MKRFNLHCNIFKFRSKLKSKILDVVELAYIKKIAISCLDKTISIYDLYNERCLMKID